MRESNGSSLGRRIFIYRAPSSSLQAFTLKVLGEHADSFWSWLAGHSKVAKAETERGIKNMTGLS
jgi:hypothetical protein